MALSYYFGQWLIQQLVLPYKPWSEHCPQINLNFQPPPRCTADVPACEVKDPQFYYSYICDHWPSMYSTVLHCWTRCLWGRKVYIHTTHIYLNIGPQKNGLYFQPPPSCTAGLAGHEDKYPYFHCRYTCDHWPSMYWVILHCWTTCLWRRKVYIDTTHISLTTGPQISLYFQPPPNYTTGVPACEVKDPHFHYSYIQPLALIVLYMFYTAGPDALEDERFELGPMYATRRQTSDRRKTKASLNATTLWGRMHNNLHLHGSKPVNANKKQCLCWQSLI